MLKGCPLGVHLMRLTIVAVTDISLTSFEWEANKHIRVSQMAMLLVFQHSFFVDCGAQEGPCKSILHLFFHLSSQQSLI
jgi:hypothetical protein